MQNLFAHASSYWVRYNQYEIKTGKNGSRYIMAAPAAEPKVYDPLKDSEKLYVWDKIIPLLTVCAAHFFKDKFHDDLLCVFWFRQLLGYFYSFPITAFQVTTNEPQSYVLDGRTHPLHSNS